MKHLFLLTLCCCLVSLSGCIRFPSSNDESEATIPIADPVESPQEKVNKEDKGTFRVKFETSKGDFYVDVYRAWSPLGAERFHKLVESGYYNECRFFRYVKGFVVQWGLHGDPEMTKKWRESNIKDDPVVASNKRGTICYAKAGPNTRTTQVFINFEENQRLDGMGFSPFGEVIHGMDRVENLESKYGEQPDQGKIQQGGNEYLNSVFPGLDYIIKATIVQETGPGEPIPPLELEGDSENNEKVEVKKEEATKTDEKKTEKPESKPKESNKKESPKPKEVKEEKKVDSKSDESKAKKKSDEDEVKKDESDEKEKADEKK